MAGFGAPKTGVNLTGKKLNHYILLEKLGAGGMSIVYKAEDTKLERTVAIKFLPPQLAGYPEKRQRFKIEAKAVAALNHPNIATIHSIDQVDGQLFIVMEYIKGTQLSDLIRSSGALPLADVQKYSVQIAQGLQEAHAHDIIHRDIKSANIMITASDQVKIMDFGLAKIGNGVQLTKDNSMLGTAAYMSPEQVSGEAVDCRTDLWSFGVVMHEMLTGQLPFQGEFQQALFYSILEENPPSISTQRKNTPAELDRLVDHCLKKDKRDRCQSAEMALEILNDSMIKYDSTEMRKRPSLKKKSISWKRLVGFMALFFIIVTSVFFSQSTKRTPRAPVKHLQFTSYPGEEALPSFSPDGNQIVFCWNGIESKNWDIYTKQIGVGTYEPTRLTTDPAPDFAPVWSPDGKYVAFFLIFPDTVNVYRIPAQGGNEQKLTSLTFPSPLSWSPDGKYLVFFDVVDSPQSRTAIYQMSVETMQRHILTDPPDDQDDFYGTISPDGKMLAFVRGQRTFWSFVHPHIGGDMTNQGSDIYVKPVGGGEAKQLTFDRSAILGLTWSHDNKDIIFASDRINGYSNLKLWRVSAKGGKPVSVSTKGDKNYFPALSPGGEQLAYVRGTHPSANFWRYSINPVDGQSQPPQQIIYSSSLERSAEYSPDGSKIVFASERSGNDEIWVCDSKGGNPVRLTFFDGPRTGTPRWSPDGEFIAFDSWEGGKPHIYAISVDGGQPRRITPDSLFASQPFWSNDGNWIYFCNDNIWKVPSTGGKAIQVTTNGGRSVRLSPNGEWLYYTRRGSILRKSTVGGEESMIMDDFCVNPWGDWVVFDDAIYYIGFDQNEKLSVRRLDIATGSRKTITQLEKYAGYFHISPDRKYVLALHGEPNKYDLFLSENWR